MIGSDSFWNLVNIVVLIVAIGFNIGYYVVHVNGKKYIRLWIGVILFVALILRTLLAVGFFDESEFVDFYRPFAALINLAFIFGPYIDWGLPKKSLKRG